MAAELLRKQYLTLCYELPQDQPQNLKDSALRAQGLPTYIHSPHLLSSQLASSTTSHKFQE